MTYRQLAKMVISSYPNRLSSRENKIATTRYLHLHLHARTLLSSAIRLALLGPFQAQHIMTRAQSKARFIDAKTADLKIEDAAQTFLVGDICSGIHGRLWTRLFNS